MEFISNQQALIVIFIFILIFMFNMMFRFPKNESFFNLSNQEGNANLINPNELDLSKQKLLFDIDETYIKYKNYIKSEKLDCV